MATFSVIPASAHHCGQMCRLLRREHRTACAARVGADVHKELRALFDQSTFSRAWLIDGKLAALGGVAGSVLSTVGFAWLALSGEAARYPIALVKEVRRQLAEIMVVKREVATTIISGDDAALRLAVFLGFHVAHAGPGQPAASRAERLELARFLEFESGLHLPCGDGYVIALGYHPGDTGERPTVEARSDQPAGDDAKPADGTVPATVAEAIHFATGMLDMISVIAATLIGHGILEATAFQGGVENYAELWREKNLPARALAAELFGERLETIAKAKLTGKGPAPAQAPRLN